jgi:phosphate-selective porin OprO and OprP
VRTIVTGALLLASFAVDAQTDADLDQRLRILERKHEIQAEEAAAKSKDGARATAGEKGFAIASADGSWEFKLRGLLQFDGRTFIGDDAAFNDTFQFRRIEPTVELTLGKLAYARIQPQFAGDSASVSDAYGELRFSPYFQVRGGKFKQPIGLENLQSSSAITFIERGLPTELSAGRDLGLQFQGDLLGGTTSYAVGYFNGTVDGRDGPSTDVDNRKETVARLFVEPFKPDPGFLQGLGFGLAGSTGTRLGTASATLSTNATVANATLPRYRSPGQNQIFSYLLETTTAASGPANTVVANGAQTRVAPQLYFYRNQFGLLGEYITSKQDVSRNGVDRTFEHVAWQGVASWVLTGEAASYRGAKPSGPYTVGGPGWGALELAARYGVLDIDDAVFQGAVTDRYADPARSVSEARTVGGAINWYLTANARFALNYDQTEFIGGAATGADRDTERAVFGRLQFSF